MTDQDLERAVAAALKAGLQTAEDIAAYIIERATPKANRVACKPAAAARRPAIAAGVAATRPDGAMH